MEVLWVMLPSFVGLPSTMQYKLGCCYRYSKNSALVPYSIIYTPHNLHLLATGFTSLHRGGQKKHRSTQRLTLSILHIVTQDSLNFWQNIYDLHNKSMIFKIYDITNPMNIFISRNIWHISLMNHHSMA